MGMGIYNKPANEPVTEGQSVKCCGNCLHYFDDVCTKDWNNMDESYYIPDRDDKEPDDTCDDWEYNEMLDGDG